MVRLNSDMVVDYVSHMGNDETVVNAARVSFKDRFSCTERDTGVSC